MRLPVEQVSTVHECRPPEVCECGGPVKAGKPLRHQVWDVPAQIRPEVQEYRLYQGVCQHCGKTHASTLPAGVPRGQLGPRALALVGLLGTKYHLTQPKIRDLLAQTMGVNFSVGAISQAHALVSQALQAPVAHAADTLRHAPVVQPRLAVYSILPSRARYCGAFDRRSTRGWRRRCASAPPRPALICSTCGLRCGAFCAKRGSIPSTTRPSRHCARWCSNARSRD